MDLDEEDIQNLMRKYMQPNGLISYDQLCKNVDFVFSDRADPAQVIAKAQSASKFEDSERHTLYTVISQLRQIVKANRILLKPAFQDFDPANTQHITLQQFSRVLKQMQIMPEQHIFELVCKNYFDKGNTREVNYVKFCHDVDKPDDLLG